MKSRAYEDLAYIREIMADTRRAANISGGYFILWGVVTSLGLLLTWLQVVGQWPYRPLLTWLPCLGAGVLGHMVLVWRDKQYPVQDRAGWLVGAVWMSLGVTQLILMIASLGFNVLPGAQLPAVFSCLLGTGIFLTGVLAGLSWLRNLALVWWAGAFVMFAWPGAYVSLLMGGLLLVFYVIPGVVLIKQQRLATAEGAEGV